MFCPACAFVLIEGIFMVCARNESVFVVISLAVQELLSLITSHLFLLLFLLHLGIGTAQFSGPSAEHLSCLIFEKIEPDNYCEACNKFVADREGNVIKRFEPTESMKEVENFIKNLM